MKLILYVLNDLVVNVWVIVSEFRKTELSTLGREIVESTIMEQNKRNRRKRITILEENITFNIMNETLDGIFGPRSTKKLSNECKKWVLVMKYV